VLHRGVAWSSSDRLGAQGLSGEGLSLSGEASGVDGRARPLGAGGIRAIESNEAAVVDAGHRGGFPPPDRPAFGWPNHPKPNGVASHPLGGGLATPAYFPLFFLFGFWISFFFFKKKKSDGGILGIKRSNELNCHNLKVWEG
jgi:hypothetical protein